jgi:hypothetical protein
MRVPPVWTFSDAPVKYVHTWMHHLIGEIGQLWNYVQTATNGQLTFGDGNDVDNMKGRWMRFTAPSGTGEFFLLHELGAVPVGYLVFRRDTPATLYDGGTPWTKTHIYLRSSGAVTNYLIFVMLGPEQP